jgi:hypothetical protein
VLGAKVIYEKVPGVDRTTSGMSEPPQHPLQRMFFGRPKYQPRDYTGEGDYKHAPKQRSTDPEPQLVQGSAGSNLAKFGKAFQIRKLQQISRDIRPILSPPRKIMARHYTQPLQDIVTPFLKNRQQGLPGSTQVSLKPNPQSAQPSIRVAGPQANIPTSMAWNNVPATPNL